MLPLNLIFVYPRWQIDARNALTYLPLVLLVAAFASCWVWWRGWGRSLFFGLGYFVVMLLPVLGFINIYFMRYSLVADHWQYFAILGLVLAAAVIRRPLYGRAALADAGHADLASKPRFTRTVNRSGGQPSPRNPGCTMARNNLSRALLDKRPRGRSHVLCQPVLAISPNDVTAQIQFGRRFAAKGAAG